MKAIEFIKEGWSQKYKSSINCSHPKGFSQKAHCAGKKKHNESVDMEMVCEDCGMCETHGNSMMEVKQRLDAKCWKGKHKEGTKIKGGIRVNNCVPNESVQESKERCQQCGMTDCTCAPGKCKCKPIKGWIPNKGFKEAIDEAEKKGLYYNVNKRKAAGTSRPASSPKAPTAQAWKDAAKTAKKEDMAEAKRTMSRVAKGNKKYGKDGMAALRDAAAAGASEEKMDKIRDEHDNYNEGFADLTRILELSGLTNLVEETVDPNKLQASVTVDGEFKEFDLTPIMTKNNWSGNTKNIINQAQKWLDNFLRQRGSSYSDLTITYKGAKLTASQVGNVDSPDPFESLTLDEQFDIIEEMVEQLAEQHGVDPEVIWEDFESVEDTELFESAAWRRSEGKSKKGGLNAKGVASYRRENPGSKLQTAVTTKPSKLKPGSKAAKRRKSFCARMGGVKGPMKKPNGKPTRKALALRKWNC